MKQPLAAIVGPTAVGKTALSILLAQELDGELLSCDSMQIYQGMDIGTAKATAEEQAQVRHHLLDICSPFASFSVADYQKAAFQTIDEVGSRGKLPILVGGTGLFYQAVVDQYDFAPELKRPDLREKWEKLYAERGQGYLQERLAELDPVYLKTIGVNDTKRPLHALEVCEAAGRPFSELIQKREDTFQLAAVGLYMPREMLYDRIDRRVEQMLEQGLVDEVKTLQRQGLSCEMQAMQAIGYQQALYYLDGLLTEEQMVHEIKRDSRNYAKRQYTWFKKDRRIFWVNTGSGIPLKELAKGIKAYVQARIRAQ